MKKFIMLLGPPGSGKGTHSKYIAEYLNLSIISIGKIFRKNIQYKTKLGKKIKKYLNLGKLAPDHVTLSLVKRYVKNNEENNNGFLLDGFPRTSMQAKEMNQFINKNKKYILKLVLEINVPYKELLFRLKKRFILENRNDDNELIAKSRLNSYTKDSNLLLNFYKKSNILRIVNGNGSIKDVKKKIFCIIDKCF